MNHTPGPWHCNGQTVYGPLTDGDRDYICTCGDVVHDEHAANARLIAAAPELVAALRAIVNTVTHPKSTKNEMRLIAEECRAALAKANA